jgi:hypothetical protein
VKHGRLIFYVVAVLFLISIFPWHGNYITKYESGLAKYQRIRTKEFPKEYFNLNYFLSQNKIESKGIYLPSGIIIELSDDERFKGKYQGFYDIFAAHSTLSGWYPSNSRNSGYGDYFIKKILYADSYTDFIKLSNVSAIIIRKNMVMDNLAGVIDLLDGDNNFTKFFDSETVVAYKRNADNFLPHFYTSQKSIISQRTIDNLPNITSGPDWQTRSIIFLAEQNLNKASVLTKIQQTSDGNSLPTIEFKKINPTKYRVRVHSANGVFPLVFSESFHDGWKAYLASPENFKLSLNDQISKYKILDGNQEDQATKDELRDYIDNGYVTTLGDSWEKTIEHKKWVDGQEKLDYTEKYNINFVSKNFQGTIQNDNLPNGNIFETWLKKPIENNANHLVANGYANSWVIDVDEICGVDSLPAGRQAAAHGNDTVKCVKNPDGSYDFELIVEFWPQRLFYIGLFISGMTLLCCVGYLGYDWKRRRRIKLGVIMV